MKWCVIGAGGIADRRFIPALLKGNNVLVAVACKTLDSAKRVGEKYGVKYYTDIDKMLLETECDAVYIGTPVACHYEQALKVLSYGKHVFIEKPIALNERQSKKLVNAFKKKGKQLTVGYMMKYHNLHQKAKRLISDGKIGQVCDIRAQFSCWYPEIEGAWRQTEKLGGGGAVMDLGVHCIELIEYVTGEKIVDVKSFYSTHTFSYRVEDGCVFIFKTQSGALGHIDVNFNIPDGASESKLEFYGTKGYVICNGTMGQEEKGRLSYLYCPQDEYSAMQSREQKVPQEYFGDGEDLYLKQINDFTSLVQSEKTDYFYTDQAVRVQKTVDKIYKDKQK